MSGSARFCAIAAGALLWVLPVRADTLRIALGGGGKTAYAAALTRAVLLPLTAATHQKFAVVPLPQRLDGSGWDVALLDPLTLTDACASGRIARLDWSSFGGRGRFVPGAASDCGVGGTLSSTVLTWDTAKVKITPSWADFWDVARLPGRRGLRRSPIGTLEIALMADGVAPVSVYATLSAKDGVARAFRKLDQLRPYIVWWENESEPVSIVASGGALMSSAPSEQIGAAGRRLHRSFGVQWSGAIASVQSWAIGAGSSQTVRAAAFINAAEDPRAAAIIFAQTGLGGTMPGDSRTPAAEDASPTAHFSAALPLDVGFWHDHQAALTKRFNDWLKH
jgi:putative spermidine/putrescine transport system substrate-binding protein